MFPQDHAQAGEFLLPRILALPLLHKMIHPPISTKGQGASTAGWEPEHTNPVLFFPVFNDQKEESL